jgi:hypothetical protein
MCLHSSQHLRVGSCRAVEAISASKVPQVGRIWFVSLQDVP